MSKEILLNKLEKQLAEKEQIIKEMEQEINERDKRIDRLEEDYYQETRQLEWVNEQLTEAEKQLEKQATIHYKHLEEQDQDKISFCIEKLEKVKKLFEERYRYDVEESEYAVVYEDDVDEIIDNQIKELKKEIE